MTPSSTLPSKVVPAILKLASRPRGRLATLAIRIGFVAVVVLALLHLRIYLPELPDGARLHQWTWNPEMENSPIHGSAKDAVCAPFSGLERVVITVKTGATEATQRLPLQMETTLRCAPHVYHYSDMAQRIGNLEVYDALAETADEIKDGNPDFDIYRKQQELKDPEKIVSQLKSMKSPDSNDLAAWTLDKYKNMHLVEKTWALKPNMDWYLHIDADTYVFWPSFIEWVKRLDTKKDLFLGSMSYVGDNPFAHGGSGILMSGEAMRTFAADHTGTAARWDPEVHNNCCGDFLLAMALKEYGIGPVMNSWPTLNGESQNTVGFSDEHWCQPVVTLHHVSVDEMTEVGDFEDRRPNKNIPVTYEEIFRTLQANKFPERQKHWDNMAWGLEVQDVENMEACVALCIEDEKCFQAKFDGWECTLGTGGFLLGQQRMPDGSKTWESYWNTTRIAAWVNDQKPCPAVVFPHQH